MSARRLSLALRPKNEKRFTKRINEPVPEFIFNHKGAAVDSDIESENIFGYLHHLLYREAKRIYRKYVRNQWLSIEEVCVKLKTELTSMSRKVILKYLPSLTLTLILGKAFCEVRGALEEFRLKSTKVTLHALKHIDLKRKGSNTYVKL